MAGFSLELVTLVCWTLTGDCDLGSAFFGDLGSTFSFFGVSTFFGGSAFFGGDLATAVFSYSFFSSPPLDSFYFDSLFPFYLDDLDSFDLSFDPCFECTNMPTAPAVGVLFAVAGKRGLLGSSLGDLSSDATDPCAARCRVAW